MPLSDRDRRALTIGGIIAGVLLVGVLLMSLLGGGEEEAAPPATTSPTTEPTETASPTPGGESPTVAPTPVASFAGRDPFSVPGVFASTSTTTTTSPGTSPTTSPGTNTTTTTTTTTQTTPGQGGNGTDMGGHEVVLVDVFTVSGVPTVQVSVDGTVYTVSEGESFGPGDVFELRTVSGNCASMLFGDDAFTLCVSPQK